MSLRVLSFNIMQQNVAYNNRHMKCCFLCVHLDICSWQLHYLTSFTVHTVWKSMSLSISFEWLLNLNSWHVGICRLSILRSFSHMNTILCLCNVWGRCLDYAVTQFYISYPSQLIGFSCICSTLRTILISKCFMAIYINKNKQKIPLSSFYHKIFPQSCTHETYFL